MTNVTFVLDILFSSNVSESEPLEADSVVLSCRIRSHGNLKPNVTVELSDGQSGRLLCKEYSPLNYSTAVQYHASITSSMSGPFYCTVAATVTFADMDTVSKTLNVTLTGNRVLGELFERVAHSTYHKIL